MRCLKKDIDISSDSFIDPLRVGHVLELRIALECLAMFHQDAPDARWISENADYVYIIAHGVKYLPFIQNSCGANSKEDS
jgi:hypothetical protein